MATSTPSQVYPGGRFRPLTDKDLGLIVAKALSILEEAGLRDRAPWEREARRWLDMGVAVDVPVPPDEPRDD